MSCSVKYFNVKVLDPFLYILLLLYWLLQLLTDQWPGILNQKDKRGRTALYVAISTEGSQDMLQHLLSCKDCDVNASDARKTTPLHWAAVSNRPDIALPLLNCGAKVRQLTPMLCVPILLIKVS